MLNPQQFKMSCIAQMICPIFCFFIILGAVHSRIIHEEPSLKIIGGSEAAPHSAPYTVRLQNKNYNATSGKYFYTLCGGSIISQEYVLTAKHCVATAESSTIFYGKHNINTREVGEVQLQSTTFKVHPTYDLALIKTPYISYTATFKNVDLPKDASESYIGQVGSAYGWGRTADDGTRPSVLMKVNLPVISLSECNSDLAPFHLTASNHEICTSGKGVKGTCQGDSGGPFVVGNSLVGVTSWGPPGCESGGPSVYVHVNKFLDWIHENTGIAKN